MKSFTVLVEVEDYITVVAEDADEAEKKAIEEFHRWISHDVERASVMHEEEVE